MLSLVTLTEDRIFIYTFFWKVWSRSWPALYPGWFLGILVCMFRYDSRFIIWAPPHIKSTVDIWALFFLEDKSAHLELLFMTHWHQKNYFEEDFCTRILEAVDLQLSTIVAPIKPINCSPRRFDVFCHDLLQNFVSWVPHQSSASLLLDTLMRRFRRLNMTPCQRGTRDNIFRQRAQIIIRHQRKQLL